MLHGWEVTLAAIIRAYYTTRDETLARPRADPRMAHPMSSLRLLSLLGLLAQATTSGPYTQLPGVRR
jgi:hypothetical protein